MTAKELVRQNFFHVKLLTQTLHSKSRHKNHYTTIDLSKIEHRALRKTENYANFASTKMWVIT